MIEWMNNEFRVSVVRKGCQCEEFGFRKQSDSSGCLWSFSQSISILPALLPISTLRYRVGRIVSAPRILCLHVNILLVYERLGLAIASMMQHLSGQSLPIDDNTFSD